MRFVLEVTVLGLLLFLGWEKPFKRWVNHPPPAVPPTTLAAKQTEVTAHSPTPALGHWMWDRNRATPLDRGAYNHDENVARAAEFYSRPTPAGGVDKNGRRYWIDQQGVRHYY